MERTLSGPNWKLKALLVVLAISLFRAFPTYDALHSNFVEGKWRDVQVKFDHPLADMRLIFPAGSHESNLTFRLTVPIVAHALRLRRSGVLILSAFAGVLLLYIGLHLAHVATASRKAALFVCLGIACVWPGEAAFHELRGGYYDAVALCLLLLAFYVRSPVLAAVVLFLAAWTDERALVSSSFFLIPAIKDKRGAWDILKGKPAAALAAVAAYLATRAYLAATHSYSTGVSGAGLFVLSQQTNVTPLAIWTGLGGCWLVVLLALLALFSQKRYASAAGFCGALLLVGGGSASGHRCHAEYGVLRSRRLRSIVLS